ncbi:MAG TPA: glucose 1-dehydrogenase [Actinomycetota bacterium]
MKGLTAIPHRVGTVALTDVPEPSQEEGVVLVESLMVGICGTDEEIIAGKYGWAPPGRPRLVLGHEALGRVIDAPPDADVSQGDLVVPFVRHPDPEPCPNCAVGEWDMCRNGRYTEHGIKERDGFLQERYRVDLDRLVRIDPSLGELGVLLEPTSIVAKCWDHVTRIGSRARWHPRRALVTGAGPVGLLAAMLGIQRGLEVHILDRHTDGPKPTLAREVGATYHSDLSQLDTKVDVVVECTGSGALVFETLRRLHPNGVMALAGLAASGRTTTLELDAVNKALVLENLAAFGSVNANRRHYETATAALAAAERGWLRKLITRTVPLERWEEALDEAPDDVKVVIRVGS